jgi:hypothetical protein
MEISYRSLSSDAFRPENQSEAIMLGLAKVESEVLCRRYILSPKQTPGIGYDDRLQTRLGLGRNTILKYIREGKLKAAPSGKVIVAESAIRRFQDPEGYPVAGVSHMKAA